MRLHIAVHNTLTMAEVEGLEEFKDIETNINIIELGVQGSEIGVVDVLKDERGCLALDIERLISRLPRRLWWP